MRVESQEESERRGQKERGEGGGVGVKEKQAIAVLLLAAMLLSGETLYPWYRIFRLFIFSLWFSIYRSCTLTPIQF